MTLTPRELLIVQSLSHGLTAEKISKEMGIRVDILRRMITDMAHSLSVKNSVELVAFALRNRLIE